MDSERLSVSLDVERWPRGLIGCTEAALNPFGLPGAVAPDDEQEIKRVIHDLLDVAIQIGVHRHVNCISGQCRLNGDSCHGASGGGIGKP